MDRFTANTLRTLGIIGAAVLVLLASVWILLLSLCSRIIITADKGRPPAPPSDFLKFAMLIGIFMAPAIVAIIGGTSLIAFLARGIVRSVDLPLPTRASVSAGIASLATQAKELLPPTPQPASVDVATHLSPASTAVIQQLSTAIVVKIAAEVLLGLVGWYGALGVPRAPFPVFRIGFMAWGLAAIAPHIILLYALARRPGRTAFAYALVIPTIHILFGTLGHSAFLAFILRAGQVAAPLLSIIPWMIDIVILYLAWKAIRLTGLLPDPRRLIAAATVIFLYTSLLPALVFLLNYLHH
ncbi:MAG: hypothetical protein WA485_05945 [Candidatus Sulfotelmatobacter sp.]